jgi:hypothetical protein
VKESIAHICRTKISMNFKQRVLRYLIGFGIGSLVVFFMFPNYDWLGWTPQKQVMQTVREAEFSLSSKANCQSECLGVNNDQIQLARQEGKIDFAKSDVKADPKVYFLEYGLLDLKIQLTDTTAVLVDLASDGKICDCP